MAARKLTITSRVKNAPATIKTIYQIDSGVRAIKSSADKTASSMAQIKPPPANVLALIEKLSEGMAALQESTIKTQRHVGSMADALHRVGSQGGQATRVAAKGVLRLDAAIGVARAGVDALSVGLEALKKPIGIAANFETGAAALKTISDEVTEETIGKLEQLAKEVPQSQADIMKAAYDALSAQIGEKNLLATLKSGSDLAVLGMSSLEDSINIVTTATKGWANQSLDAADVQDFLFASVRQGRFTLTELNASLGQVASTAGGFNVPIQETLASIATLTKRGNDVAKATVQINQLITSVIKPTKDAAERMDALGIAYGTTALEAGGLSGFLAQVNEKASTQDLPVLFNNIRALRGATGLLSDGLSEFNKDLTAINGSSGLVANKLGIVKATTNAAREAFEALVEGVLLQLGNEILPVVNAGFRAMTDWWDRNGDFLVDGLGKIKEQFIKLVDSGALKAVAAGLVLIALSTGPIGVLAIAISGLTIELINLSDEADKASRDNAKVTKEVNSEYEKQIKLIKARAETALSANKKQLDLAVKTANQRGAFGALSERLDALETERTRLSADAVALAEKRKANAKKGAAAAAGNATDLEIQRLETERRGINRNSKAVKDLQAQLDGALAATKARFIPTELLRAKEEIARRDALLKRGQMDAKAEKDREARAKRAAKGAEKLARERGKAIQQAQEDHLFHIEDTDTRGYSRLLLRQERALEAKVALMGKGHQAVMSLELRQAVEREEALAQINERAFKPLQAALDRADKAQKRSEDKARKRRDKILKEEKKQALALKEIATGTAVELSRSMGQAAASAVFYGDSFSKAINQTLQALTVQAAGESVAELAKGLASLAIYDGKGATNHFASSAVWAGLAGAAGLGAAATGGFDKGDESGGAGGSFGSDSDFTESGTPALRDRSSAGGVEDGGAINIYINSAVPLTEGTMREVGAMTRKAVSSSERSRGATKWDSAKLDRKRRA